MKRVVDFLLLLVFFAMIDRLPSWVGAFVFGFAVGFSVSGAWTAHRARQECEEAFHA